MKLLRLAIPTFYPAPAESWRSRTMNTLGSGVQTMGAYGSEGGTGFVVRAPSPTFTHELPCGVVKAGDRPRAGARSRRSG